MSSPFTSGKLDFIEIHCREKKMSAAQPSCSSAHPGSWGACWGAHAGAELAQACLTSWSLKAAPRDCGRTAAEREELTIRAECALQVSRKKMPT